MCLLCSRFAWGSESTFSWQLEQLAAFDSVDVQYRAAGAVFRISSRRSAVSPRRDPPPPSALCRLPVDAEEPSGVSAAQSRSGGAATMGRARAADLRKLRREAVLRDAISMSSKGAPTDLRAAGAERAGLLPAVHLDGHADLGPGYHRGPSRATVFQVEGAITPRRRLQEKARFSLYSLPPDA